MLLCHHNVLRLVSIGSLFQCSPRKPASGQCKDAHHKGVNSPPDSLLEDRFLLGPCLNTLDLCYPLMVRHELCHVSDAAPDYIPKWVFSTGSRNESAERSLHIFHLARVAPLIRALKMGSDIQPLELVYRLSVACCRCVSFESCISYSVSRQLDNKTRTQSLAASNQDEYVSFLYEARQYR